MGIIHSLGEYLMNLDPDDEFAAEDSLEYLYNLTHKKVDIVNFAILKKASNKIINKCNYFLKKEKSTYFLKNIIKMS